MENQQQKHHWNFQSATITENWITKIWNSKNLDLKSSRLFSTTNRAVFYICPCLTKWCPVGDSLQQLIVNKGWAAPRGGQELKPENGLQESTALPSCQTLAQPDSPGSSPAQPICPTSHTLDLCVCTQWCPFISCLSFQNRESHKSAPSHFFFFLAPFSIPNICKNGMKSFEQRLGMSSPPS